MGNILRLVRWYERHDIARVPSVQEVVSSGRVVTCATASAGTRDGTAGTTSGHAALPGAFAEAAVLFLRDHPAGQKSRARLEKTHGQGKALTVLAPTRARAVYDLLNRGVVFDLDTLLHRARGGAGEPAASRGHAGRSLATVLCHHTPRASTHAQEPIGPWP